jgi:class 3 adenylate cyclase/tetratricopeptide (TPR) repeat protein
MPCPRCQHENPAGVKFCGECGARLDVACPACRAVNPPGNKFCHECGEPLPAASAPTATPSTTPAAPSPQFYIPPHLAERIISSRGALEGERKQVTVLFADLKGSMELLADRDPEEARRLLDPVLERMMDAVHRYEGTVNQVMGDGIMALFGAPLAHEDHAVRACYAALRMQEAAKEYADEVWRSQNVRLQVRVGLNSGEVVVRSIGSDLRMDYTAVGQTTHLAARMEQLASPGSILLAPDTLQLAEGYVQVKGLGPVQVRGLSEPVEVYELVGAGTARSRLQAIAARGLTRFVGRDAELETLRQSLERAGGGQGQVVALVGEPGVGKSRLVWEFTHSHRTQGWLVLESGSVSYGKATSYLPVVDLLRLYFQIEAADDHRRMRQKVLGRVLDLDEALRPALSPLLSLLDVPAEDAQWQALDPAQRRERTFEAVKRLLLRESQEQPLLLVFEDLHWIDAETQSLLDSLVESLPTQRLLLLVNYRPEYEHTWHRKTYYRELRLDPLPPESADALLAALLGSAPALEPLQRTLVARTEGNPFFLEESVRALVEMGALVGERGAYRLGRPLDAIQVPATVQAVLAARLDRLAPEDKRLLQCAAVIGKDVPYPLLEAVAELSEPALRQGLARLQAAEFLYETSLFPELEYTFKHALTHEVSYGSLLHERRRSLHGQIVAALERLYTDRLPEQSERLAHHALQGEIWEKAADYLEQAGNRAVARSAHREAVRAFEQALGALEHLPPTPPSQRRAIDLHLRVRHSLITLGEISNLVDHLSEAERLATALQDQHRLGRVLAELTNQHGRTGDYRSALEAGQRARAIAAALGDRSIAVATNHYLTHAYHALGQYDQAIERETENLAMLADEHLARTVGGAGFHAPGSRAWLADCLAERGQFAAARALVEEAEQIAVALDHPFTLVDSLVKIGVIFSRQGDYELALLPLQRALNICEQRQVELLRPSVALELGHVYTQLGQPGEALALLTPALEWLRHRSIYAREARAATWLAEAELAIGSHDEALTHGTHALTRARARGEQGNEALALRLLGEIAAQAEPPDVAEAEARYGEALALAGELGMRPLLAHCHLDLGTLYRKIGREEQARAELADAIELYRAMEMPYWLARAEAAGTPLGAP